MLQAKYPIENSKEYIKVTIDDPLIDPLSENNDYFCKCRIHFTDKLDEFDVYGIDPMQACYLAFGKLKIELVEYQRTHNKYMDYCFF